MPYALNGRVRIYWEEEGSGEPLLMIMGLGFSLAMWGKLRTQLAQRFRVILFDNRCVGQSARVLRPFSIRKLASDSARVLEAAGAASAHVLGISMGGMISQEFAIRYPDRVTKLVLGCTHAGGFRSVRAKPRVLRTLASPFGSRDAKLAAMIPFLYDPGTPRDRIEADLELVRPNAPTVLGYMLQLAAIVSWQSYPRLPKITAPTLVIHGQGDQLVPPENARIIAERIPTAKLVLIPNAGHIFPTDQPEITRNELFRFLTVGSASCTNGTEVLR